MFGTIAHARPKPGHEDQLTALLEEWRREIRPAIRGKFLSLNGHLAGQPDEQIFVGLAEDEATYRMLAASPAQDAWFRKLMEHIEGEPQWEDVELEIIVDE